MKIHSYLIILLIVGLLVVSSFLYKEIRKPIFHHFPVKEIAIETDVDNPFYLLLFFSRFNCRDCLEIIDTLNTLEKPFFVYGLIPSQELMDEKTFRLESGAQFPLIKAERFSKYYPLYSPTLLGISQKGQILFTLPAVPHQNEYFTLFLNNSYEKAYHILLDTD